MDLRAAARPGHVRRALRATWCTETDFAISTQRGADPVPGQRHPHMMLTISHCIRLHRSCIVSGNRRGGHESSRHCRTMPTPWMPTTRHYPWPACPHRRRFLYRRSRAPRRKGLSPLLLTLRDRHLPSHQLAYSKAKPKLAGRLNSRRLERAQLSPAATRLTRPRSVFRAGSFIGVEPAEINRLDDRCASPPAKGYEAGLNIGGQSLSDLPVRPFRARA
jgi:hypothetical protein